MIQGEFSAVAIQKNLSKFQHISGLDGLRALSVLVVMLYHSNIPIMSGGYLGVEIFFVISGFLITSLLLHEASRNNGKIHLVNFWKRRAARLLPALLGLLFFVTLLGAFVLTENGSQFRLDIVASLFYFENWYQICSGGSYFADQGFPLLKHIWSLAVEEQFYLIWPILLSFTLRNSKDHNYRPPIITTILFAASFCTMVSLSYDSARNESMMVDILNRAYLGTDTRAFGLLSGALFAMTSMKAKINYVSNSVLDIMSLLSLAAILVLCSVVNIKSSFLYQGGFLLTDILTLIVIYSFIKNETGTVKRFLSVGLLEWIGKRSYGIYLWHWPVFKLVGTGQSGYDWIIIRFIVTFLISEVSFRWLETPIRESVSKSSRQKFNRLVAVPAFGSAVIVLAFSGYVLSRQAPYVDEVKESLALNAKSVELNTEPFEPTHNETAKIKCDMMRASTSLPSHSNVYGSDDSDFASLKSVKITAIGDSVMKGASIALKEVAGSCIGKNNIVINAKECRSFGAACNIVNSYRQQSRLGNVVVIHLGTNNSSISKKDFNQLVDLLSKQSLILFLTAKSDKVKICDNVNATLERYVRDVPNAHILDWKALSLKHPRFFYSDRTHLRPEGAKFYAAAIFDNVSQHLKDEARAKRHLVEHKDRLTGGVKKQKQIILTGLMSSIETPNKTKNLIQFGWSSKFDFLKYAAVTISSNYKVFFSELWTFCKNVNFYCPSQKKNTEARFDRSARNGR